MCEIPFNQIMLREFRKLAILTDEEDSVLTEWARNKSNAYIGIILGIPERTVIRRIDSLRKKYDAVQKYSPLLPRRL